jgi:Protein of unknown function (DUF3307)
VDWVEVFAVLVVSHLVGDFLLQTDWQATSKFGGLARGRAQARRALLSHVLTYTLCFVPALVWLAAETGWGAVWVAVLVAVPHLIQDDGRLLLGYIRRVKHSDAEPGDLVFVMTDQSLHLLTLFFIALITAAG